MSMWQPLLLLEHMSVHFMIGGRDKSEAESPTNPLNPITDYTLPWGFCLALVCIYCFCFYILHHHPYMHLFKQLINATAFINWDKLTPKAQNHLYPFFIHNWLHYNQIPLWKYNKPSYRFISVHSSLINSDHKKKQMRILFWHNILAQRYRM